MAMNERVTYESTLSALEKRLIEYALERLAGSLDVDDLEELDMKRFDGIDLEDLPYDEALDVEGQRMETVELSLARLKRAFENERHPVVRAL